MVGAELRRDGDPATLVQPWHQPSGGEPARLTARTFGNKAICSYGRPIASSCASVSAGFLCGPAAVMECVAVHGAFEVCSRARA